MSGLSKYDNGTMLNTGYNKQSVRTNVTQTFLPNLTRVGQSELHPRRHAAQHHGQRQQLREPVRRLLLHAAADRPRSPESSRRVGVQSLRPRQSVCGCGRHRYAAGSQPIHRWRQLQLDAVAHRAPESRAQPGRGRGSHEPQRPAVCAAGSAVPAANNDGSAGDVADEHGADQLHQLLGEPHSPLHRAVLARRDHVGGLRPRAAVPVQPGDRRLRHAGRRQRAHGRHGDEQLSTTRRRSWISRCMVKSRSSR